VKKSVTLIEIIVVMVIIGIMAAIAIPNMAKNQMLGNEAAAQANLKVISAAIENYVAVKDAYPSGEGNLTGANPPYLSHPYCGQSLQGYSYSCTFQNTGYSLSAAPTSCGHTGGTTFSVTTGGNLTKAGC
jgi:prepilin-type N-terminal cleavage/methylation domain-containing protein